jgi:small subunit ribosomal protein S16
MVKIRLARRGRKKLAMFDVIVADARAPRDGRFIEKIGTYNPLTTPATINLNDDLAFQWLMKGAQPSDTVKAMLSYRGIMLRKHLQIGVIKGALTQEQADAKVADWVNSKESKIQTKRDKLAQSKQAQIKARKEAESKVKEARAEAIRQKQSAAAKAAEPAPAAESETAAAPAEEAQG